MLKLKDKVDKLAAFIAANSSAQAEVLKHMREALEEPSQMKHIADVAFLAMAAVYQDSSGVAAARLTELVSRLETTGDLKRPA